MNTPVTVRIMLTIIMNTPFTVRTMPTIIMSMLTKTMNTPYK